MLLKSQPTNSPEGCEVRDKVEKNVSISESLLDSPVFVSIVTSSLPNTLTPSIDSDVKVSIL